MLVKPRTNDKYEVLICNCRHAAHQLVIYQAPYSEKDPESEEDQLYIHFRLNKLPFWKRVKLGFMYIFGYTSPFGEYDEIITTRTELKNIINSFYE